MRRTFRLAAGVTLLGGSLFALHSALDRADAPPVPGAEAGAEASRAGASPRARRSPLAPPRPLDEAALAARGVRVTSVDPVDGRPTFLWASRGTPSPGTASRGPAAPASRAPGAPAATPALREAAVDAARRHAMALADVYGMDPADIGASPVRGAQVAAAGARVVSLGAEVDGVDVFRRELRVVMDGANELVAMSGSLPTREALEEARGRSHALSAGEAVGEAVDAALGAVAERVVASRDGADGPYEQYRLATADGDVGRARAKPVFADSPRGLVPAYYVEVDAALEIAGARAASAVVVDAEDGAPLFVNDLAASAAFAYRVYADTTSPFLPWESATGNVASPHPAGVPDGYAPPLQAPALVTLESAPFSRNDPWLPDDATTLSGNAVFAYADRAAPDGYQAATDDVLATITAPGVFDRAYDPALSPTANAEQSAASATQLFYVTNALHDWFYDAGFDEAAGNAQAANFGRGGLGGDRLLAEAQDHARQDDARAVVPADGASPRLEIGLYDVGGALLRDGAIDATLVAHEWAHVMTRRLVGDANGLTNAQGLAIDEGTADFVALLATMRAEEMSFPANSNWSGVFAVGAYVASDWAYGTYSGLRRVPYSSDMLKNALTFRHVARGAALPGAMALPPGASAAGEENHLPHHAGEVWATMLHECYVSLLKAHPFSEAQDRMKQYLVRGLAATPIDPSFVEARDALLAATAANDPGDEARFLAAFAKRGLGVGAVAPARYAMDHVGVVESFETGTRAVTSLELADSIVSCDGDGVLDVGEIGEIRITVTNAGRFVFGPFTATAAASQATAGISFPSGDMVWFPTLTPGASATGVVRVELANVTGPTPRAGLTVTLGEGSLPTADRVLELDPRVHYDVAPALASADAFELPLADWTASPGTGPRAFRVVATGGESYVHAPAPETAGEATLTSPPIAVDAAGDFVVSFEERHSFEDTDASPTGPHLDGMVIEVSVDGGPWLDVFEDLGMNPGYSAFLAGGTANPLATRAAFATVNMAWPAFGATELDFGTAFAGRTVRLRFRVGTDGARGSHGVELDDFTVSGAAAPPFSAIVAETSDGTVCNRAPTAIATAEAEVTERVSASERRVVALDAIGSFDPDGDAITYQWTRLVGPPVALTGADTAAATFVADVAADTTFVFALDVSDGVDTSRDLVEVHVVDQPFVPSASIAGAATVVERSGDVTLDGSGSSIAGGAALAYAWTQTAGPSVAFDADAAAITFTPPEVAADTALSFSLVVTGAGEGSATATHSITVLEEDRSPTVSAPGSVEVASGALAKATATGADPDGTAVTYAWTQAGGPSVELLGASTAEVAFVAPVVAAETTITLEVVASSGGESSAPASIDFVVAAQAVADAPPVLTAPASVEIAAGETAMVTATATDADGDAIAYAWTQTAGEAVTLTDAATATVSFVAPAVTTTTVLELVVTATANGLADARTVVVVVTPPPPASGGGCSAAPGQSAPAAWSIVALAAALRWRRRRGRGR